MHHARVRVLAAVLAFASCSAQSQSAPEPTLDLRGAITGSWYNPGQSGHGLALERLPNGRVALSWYTYRRDGSPFWLIGSGRQHGPQLVVQALEASGGRPPQHWDESQISALPWGELRVAFADCNNATLHWISDDPDFGEGSLALQRLTRIDGLRCNAENEFGLQLGYSFQLDAAGFTPLFADLPQNPSDIYELDARWAPLPEPLQSRAGIRLTGHNRSDDLAMLIKSPISGLQPNTEYRVELEAELASNVPTGCVGVGGSPGDSVYIKLGASTQEPLALPEAAGGAETWLRLNFDFGNQAQSGENARVVGTLANSANCDDGVDADWELKTLSTEGMGLQARSDADGRLWVVAGSDSAFEGLTRFYFTRVKARLQPQ